jgi:acyl-CoA synthetase (AMP-forming)/AMP-acid ligase II
MSGPLARLLGSGVPGAEVVFGLDGDRRSAADLGEQGARAVGPAGAPSIGALLTNDAPSVSLVLGTIATGARLVTMPLPGRGADPVVYAAFLESVRAAHGIEHIVARDDVAELLTAMGVPALPHRALGRRTLGAPTGRGFELVQFSSGSTAAPKGVLLNEHVLATNLRAILRRVEPTAGDVTVSWLPLSHDMGLIGMFLTSVAAGAPSMAAGGQIVLLDTERFLRRPIEWLDAISHWNGTFTAAPDFGFRLALRALDVTSRPLDLSRLRCAIVGGEIVRTDTMRATERALAGHGLRTGALLPAYGMAEVGLAVTMTRPGAAWAHASADAFGLADGARRAPTSPSTAVDLVSSGTALDGYAVTVEGPDEVGPLVVSAPAIGWDSATGRSWAEGGRYRTGDIGWVDQDGDVFVCGRLDDHLVVNARNLYAPAIEWAVSCVDGVRAGRTTAVGLPDGTWVVVAETQGPDDRTAVASAIRRACTKVVQVQPDRIVLVEGGALPMTASGKVQRREVGRRILSGELGG